MPPRRTARRRLAAAVTTVLALTATGTVLTPAGPASAAPAGVVATTGADGQTAAVPAFPKDDVLTGVTASGYLSRSTVTGTQSWIPASGGAPVQWPYSASVVGTGSGDLVAVPSHDAVTGSITAIPIIDVASGSVVRSYSLGPSEAGWAGAVGTSVFVWQTDSAGVRTLVMHGEDPEPRTVTGLPGDATWVKVVPGTASQAKVTYTSGTKLFLGLLDLATGAVTETYELPPTAKNKDTAVSETYVAWTETSGRDATVVVTDRATGTRQNVPMGEIPSIAVKIALQGDWLTYGDANGWYSTGVYPSQALTTYNLRTGVSRKLLDDLTSVGTAPDGTLYVRGGTVADDEGVYRVAPGEDGVPAATLVASTGVPTRVTLTGHSVPAVVDFDRGGATVPMSWQLSRGNADVKVTLRQTGTGLTWERAFPKAGTSVAVTWDGTLDGPSPGEVSSAYSGDYTWTVVATPLNGIGPDLVSSGTFQVVRTVEPHDLDGNGTPNLLARDTAGRLWNADTYDDPTAPGHLSNRGTKLVGKGWGIYDRIVAVGDAGGSAAADLIARDTAGVLWFYTGRGDGTFATRTRIGSGWQTYSTFAGGADFTGDGRTDLLVGSAAGALWVHRGTGRSAFGPAVLVGVGWNAYDKIAPAGNLGGTPAADLVARDRNGVLWLYLGRGDGSFASRIRIGGGWNAYSEIVGLGDGDHDGRPDLFAYDQRTNATYFYAGTGNVSAPFAARRTALSPDSTGNPYVPYNTIT